MSRLRIGRFTRLRAVLLAAAIAVPVGVALAGSPAHAAGTAVLDGSSVQQPVDGFGISQFWRASMIKNMSSTTRQKVLDLLFSPTTGAGLSILRLGIASDSSSIQPANPGGPTATPRYTWNHDDSGQVWLAQQAKSYGVQRFYADAWSAPGYMKSNGDQANGGTLCGLSGTSCGDWRQAYANYLIQFTKFYAAEGITITDLGAVNEPNWSTDYSSMRLTPQQAVELVKAVGPAAHAAGMKFACCDAVAWNSQASSTSAIVADSTASALVDTHTGHSYGQGPTTPLSAGGKHTWMSEWSPDGKSWDEAWDDGATMSGISVAQAIHTALTGGRVNGYVYWYGVSTGATRALIYEDGRVSARLWALASYSRYIRPGAVRIGATASDGLQLSAFRNPDGSVVAVGLNTGQSSSSLTYSLRNLGITSGTVAGYLTDGSHGMAAQQVQVLSGGSFSATVPARSLMTFLIKGSGPTPTSTSPVPTTTTTTSEPGQTGVLLSSTFEDGTTGGWAGRGAASVAVTTAQAHGGNASLQVTGRTSAWHGAQRDVSSVLRSGRTYQLAAYARLAAGESPTTLSLTVERKAGGTTSYEHVGSDVQADSSGWVRLGGSYTVPSDTESAVLYVESASTTASFLLDDVVISTDPIPTSTPPTTPTPTKTTKTSKTKTTKTKTTVVKCKTAKNGSPKCRTVTKKG